MSVSRVIEYECFSENLIGLALLPDCNVVVTGPAWVTTTSSKTCQTEPISHPLPSSSSSLSVRLPNRPKLVISEYQGKMKFVFINRFSLSCVKNIIITVLNESEHWVIALQSPQQQLILLRAKKYQTLEYQWHHASLVSFLLIIHSAFLTFYLHILSRFNIWLHYRAGLPDELMEFTILLCLYSIQIHILLRIVKKFLSSNQLDCIKPTKSFLRVWSGSSLHLARC